MTDRSFVLSAIMIPVLAASGGCVSAPMERPLQRIAFGSCAQQDRPQPIWDAIVAARPDVFLFIGDNIYADTEDMAVMRNKYAQLAAQPGYQKLSRSCPVLAVWDDHDYGVNDGGADYPRRKESERIFLDFFEVPHDSVRRTRPGVYDAVLFGPAEMRVQIILLDTRYFRSRLSPQIPGSGRSPYRPNQSPDATILGEKQWKWLAEQLRVPATIRIIVSSIQVASEDHPWEKWGNFPQERDRLFRLIRETAASGVIFLSGDRHLGELSMMDADIGYPVYDLTSSGLNRASKKWRPYEANRHRVGTMNWGDNFGMILIDWDQEDPLIRLQIRDVRGDIAIQRKIYLSTIRPGQTETQ